MRTKRKFGRVVLVWALYRGTVVAVTFLSAATVAFCAAVITGSSDFSASLGAVVATVLGLAVDLTLFTVILRRRDSHPPPPPHC